VQVTRRIALGATIGAVAAACALAPAAVAGGAPKSTSKTYNVKVRDDYYSPLNVKVRKDDKVKWAWGSTNINSHDVTLKKAPKGVKKGDYRSISGAIGITFKRKFTVPGTYNFYCTIHPDVMTMDVVVKK
jgi:plastocyanin